jgi:hypothetical protein
LVPVAESAQEVVALAAVGGSAAALVQVGASELERVVPEEAAPEPVAVSVQAPGARVAVVAPVRAASVHPVPAVPARVA